MTVIGKLYFRLSWTKNRTALNHLSAQNIPVIIVFNHTSHLDVPSVALALGMKFMRRLIMPGKKELFEHPAMAWFMRQGGAIPLNRELTDTTTVRILLRALQENRVILMSPEGTRSYDGTVQPFKSGFVKLAHRSQAAIIPVGIRGAYNAFPRGAKYLKPHKITVHVGSPITLADHLPAKPGHTDYDNAADFIQQQVVALRDQPH